MILEKLDSTNFCNTQYFHANFTGAPLLKLHVRHDLVKFFVKPASYKEKLYITTTMQLA